ncbi:hypothetical protein [uncultured Maricaulis sp.]|uniref:hypothetical protein n=1 Tax=uncultured Maricaulis sp. TaxID=174710 RepID=UPI0025E076C0|nr:hypothetical protein [uncultured Maricaulis sp.]
MKITREFALYWGTVLLCGYGAVTYGRWGLLELLVRTGTWPSDWFEFDAYGYVASMSVLQEVVFVLATLCALTAFALLVLRSRWSAAMYGAFFLASMVDWLLLVGNPFIGMGLNGYFGITVNLIALSAVIMITSMGLLKGRPARR